MESVRIRAEVNQCVKKNPRAAYALANSIPHPWYRCQSLSAIAEIVPTSEKSAILLESANAAKLCHDENRRVAVACWPLSIALKTELHDISERIFLLCCKELSKISDPMSGWIATSVLLTIKRHEKLCSEFFPVFENATRRGHGWRIERTLAYLLVDEEVQKYSKYVTYLQNRQGKILQWKIENKK